MRFINVDSAEDCDSARRLARSQKMTLSSVCSGLLILPQAASEASRRQRPSSVQEIIPNFLLFSKHCTLHLYRATNRLRRLDHGRL